jgi:hypothetical protein
MSFRVALAGIWIVVAIGGIWFLRGGFGIRLPRTVQSWLPANPSPWALWAILWSWAGVLVIGVAFVVAYFLAKGLQIVVPWLVR